MTKREILQTPAGRPVGELRPDGTDSGVVVPANPPLPDDRQIAPPVPPDGDTTILSVIARAARDPEVNIDKFERLMAMREKVEAQRKEEAFNSAMAAAQHEIPVVVKDRANDFTKSRYATLDAIIREAAPIYTKHGFSVSFGTATSPFPNHYRVNCIVSHTGGHSRPYKADVPADAGGLRGRDNKTPIQVFGSTMSYARRYLLCLIFNVAITEEDDDGNDSPPPPGPSEFAREQREQRTNRFFPEQQQVNPRQGSMFASGEQRVNPRPISADKAMWLNSLIETTGTDPTKFCEYFGLKRVEDLPEEKYRQAVAILQKKVAVAGNQSAENHQVPRNGRANPAAQDAQSRIPPGEKVMSGQEPDRTLILPRSQEGDHNAPAPTGDRYTEPTEWARNIIETLDLMQDEGEISAFMEDVWELLETTPKPLAEKVEAAYSAAMDRVLMSEDDDAPPAPH